MNSEKKEILKEQWKKVPSDIKAVILSPDLEKNIQIVLIENNLPADKAKELENETILLMMGLSGTDDYVEEIGKIFSLPENKAENILLDVEKLILDPIKNSLIEFVDKENSAENTEKYQNQNDNKGKEIILENQNPFLPMLTKEQNVKREAQNAGGDAEQREQNVKFVTHNAGQKDEGMERTPAPEEKRPALQATGYTLQDPLQDPKKPDVTSALAAEIGNLLGQQKAERGTQNTKIVTYNAEGNIEQNPKLVTQNVGQEAEGAQSAQSTTEIPLKAEDKLTQTIQKPRVEVEMVRRTETQNAKPVTSDKKEGDPYREPIG